MASTTHLAARCTQHPQDGADDDQHDAHDPEDADAEQKSEERQDQSEDDHVSPLVAELTRSFSPTIPSKKRDGRLNERDEAFGRNRTGLLAVVGRDAPSCRPWPPRPNVCVNASDGAVYGSAQLLRDGAHHSHILCATTTNRQLR